MYILVWEFSVKSGQEKAFEEKYGPDGIWCTLFKTAHGYIGSELIKDSKNANRYITKDYWKSEAAYKNFR